jgi:hypothetical protein
LKRNALRFESLSQCDLLKGLQLSSETKFALPLPPTAEQPITPVLPAREAVLCGRRQRDQLERGPPSGGLLFWLGSGVFKNQRPRDFCAFRSDALRPDPACREVDLEYRQGLFQALIDLCEQG